MQYAASNVNNALTTLPSYPEEPIYSELVFQSPPGAPGHPRPSGDMSREPPVPIREKPPYPSPPSYKSHPCYNGMAGPLRHPISEPVTSDTRRDPGGGGRGAEAVVITARTHKVSPCLSAVVGGNEWPSLPAKGERN